MTMTQELLKVEEKETKQGILIVTLTGRLDTISAPLAEQKLFNYINKGQHKILLNLEGVNYLSSAGMRVLISVTKKLKGLGRFILCQINPNVMDVLKMARFDQVLEIFKTEEDALKHF